MMDIKLEKKPAFTVVGMKYRGKNENKEIPQLWSQFLPRVSEIQNITDHDLCFGVEDNYDEVADEFDYLACIPVSHVETLPAGMERWDIPANTYAIFPTNLQKITDTYHYIYESGLADAKLERGTGPEFEYYDETFDAKDPNSTFYLYVPVKVD